MSEHLKADKLVTTLTQLQNRIRERFPESGLLKLAVDLTEIARLSPQRTRAILQIYWPLRLAAWSLVFCLPVIVFYLVRHGTFTLETDGWQLLEGIDAGISSLVFLGGAIYFVVTLERRIHRRRALTALSQLRGLAHVIDMHQLDKDPERSFSQYSATASSPKQSLTSFQLGRYLDYCSEMLSLISKISVLYGQDLDDEVVLDAVDDIEDLAGGMSRRIWQKIMLLESLEASAAKMEAGRLNETAPPMKTPQEKHPAANLEIAESGQAGGIA